MLISINLWRVGSGRCGSIQLSSIPYHLSIFIQVCCRGQRRRKSALKKFDETSRSSMRWRCDIGFLWCWPLGWSVHCARHSHHCYHKIKQGELNNGSSTLVFYISVNVNLERNFPSGGPGCLYQSGLYAGEQKCHLRFLSDLCTVQHHRSATLWEQILLNKIYCL